MAMVEINWRPSAKELRQFGVAMIVGFGLIGGLLWWRDLPTAAWVCWIVGAVAGALGLSGTRAALAVYVPWMAIALVMGNVISRVLLGVIYYGLITPIGLIARLCGRDKLQMRRVPADTYWQDAENPDDTHDYERQF